MRSPTSVGVIGLSGAAGTRLGHFEAPGGECCCARSLWRLARICSNARIALRALAFGMLACRECWYARWLFAPGAQRSSFT
jgi:hypothetical protein